MHHVERLLFFREHGEEPARKSAFLRAGNVYLPAVQPLKEALNRRVVRRSEIHQRIIVTINNGKFCGHVVLTDSSRSMCGTLARKSPGNNYIGIYMVLACFISELTRRKIKL